MVNKRIALGGFGENFWPDGFPAEVLAIVIQTWGRITIRSDMLENNITALLKDCFRACCPEDWFAVAEEQITDSETGDELGRNDFRVYPPIHKRQTIFFVIECKRLNVHGASLVSKYIEEGMMRFISGGYSKGLPCGAMLGYVMDGKTVDAFSKLKKGIEAKSDMLRIVRQAEKKWKEPSEVVPSIPESVDTIHMCKTGGSIVLHHLLLPVR